MKRIGNLGGIPIRIPNNPGTGPLPQTMTAEITRVWLSEITMSYVRSGLNYHYFHMIGDGHQPNSRGLYTHYKDSY